MLSELPQDYREDPWVIALSAAVCGVLDGQDAATRSLLAQLSLDTVTWNLATEERVAGITPPPGADIESRRSALKAKLRSGGKLTIAQIQAVADAWHNGEVAVTFPGGRVRVQFIGAFGIPQDLDGLKRAVAEVIPAHLSADYLFRYLLLRDIHGSMTLTELASRTMDQFAGGVSTWQAAQKI